MRAVDDVQRIVALALVEKARAVHLLELAAVNLGELVRREDGGDVGIVFAPELGIAEVGAAGPDLVTVEHEELVVHDVAEAAAEVAMHASRRKRADQARRIGISEGGAIGVLAVDDTAHDHAAVLRRDQSLDDVRLGAHAVDGKVDRFFRPADGRKQLLADGSVAGGFGTAVLVRGELDGIGEGFREIAGRAGAGARAEVRRGAGAERSHRAVGTRLRFAALAREGTDARSRELRARRVAEPNVIGGRDGAAA
jgi:hypothetical protein